jgi:competence protein ComEC
LARLILLGLALGFLWNCAYRAIFYEHARSFDQTQDRFTFRLLEFPQEDDYGLKISVNLILKGKPDLKSVLYLFGTTGGDYKPGQTITVKAKALLPSGRAEDDIYTQRGFFLLFYSDEEPELTGDNSASPLYYPVRLANALRKTVSDLFDERIAPFLCALLTGDKSALNKDSALLSAFKVTGAAHTVAVSGMHLSYLVGLIVLLFGKRKRTIIAAIPIIVFYVLMVGASPSVTRAAIMQIMLLVSPLVMREYDSMTALGFSLMLLLTINPFSATQAGLQLSFASVLGIHLFSEKIQAAMHRKIDRFRLLRKLPERSFGRPFSFSRCFSISFYHTLLYKVIRFLISVMALSLSAMVFVIPLTALNFGQISLLAPLTNLLILWAVSLCFSLGIISLVLGCVFIPLGKALAPLVSIPAHYILLVLKALTKIPLAAVYTRNLYMSAWLVFAYLLLGAIVFLPGISKKLRVACIPLILSFAAALCITRIETETTTFSVTALNVGQGQSIVLSAHGESAIVDCGGNRLKNAGDNAAEFLLSKGQDRLELLILTHFHEDHANGVLQLMQRIHVDTLIVPRLQNMGDLGTQILRYANRVGTNILYVENSTYSVVLGSMRLEIYPPLGGGDQNEQGLCILSSAEQFQTMITGDINEETEWMLTQFTQLPDVELLFAGHHGSKTSTSDKLLAELCPEIVIISSGPNHYGHPSPDTLARLERAGIDVYRTDQCGQISLTLN